MTSILLGVLSAVGSKVIATSSCCVGSLSGSGGLVDFGSEFSFCFLLYEVMAYSQGNFSFVRSDGR